MLCCDESARVPYCKEGCKDCKEGCKESSDTALHASDQSLRVIASTNAQDMSPSGGRAHGCRSRWRFQRRFVNQLARWGLWSVKSASSPIAIERRACRLEALPPSARAEGFQISGQRSLRNFSCCRIGRMLISLTSLALGQ